MLDMRSPRHAGYRHEAFLYRGEAEFLDGCVPFVEAALDADEPVLVALVPERLALLRSALEARRGEVDDRVQFVDMSAIGRNPARIIPAWRAFLDAAGAGGRPVRGIGEPIWAGRRPEEVDECQLHEALLNLAVEPDTSFWLRCPYDVDALPAEVIDAVPLSHPVLSGLDDFRGSTGYQGLHHVQALFRATLPPPAGITSGLRFGADDLRTLRGLLVREAGDRLPAQRLDDLGLAVHEIALNSVRHGGGSGSFRVWHRPGALTAEVRDRGHIADPLVGRVAPGLTAESGRGVWIAQQLSDLVQIRSSAGGTTVRLTAWL